MFEKTNAKTFVIGAGADGSAVAAVDLGANCKGVVLRCADCSGIPAGATLAVRAAEGLADGLCQVYDPDSGSAVAPALPSAGSWRVVLSGLFGARRVHLTLSANAGALTTFEVVGLDAGV